MEKILHLTDSDGDNEAVDGVLDFAIEEGINIVAATGDFIGPCFTQDEAGAMDKTVKTIMGRTGANLYNFGEALKFLRAQSELPEDLKQAVEVYSVLEGVFDGKAGNIYSGLEGLFKRFPGQVVLIPGNEDSSKYREHLAMWDKHLVFGNLNGGKVAGYGSARSHPIWLPPTRFIPVDDSERELFDFLGKQDPDVALLHAPPYEILDEARSNDGKTEHIGSFASLAYILRECPPLVLCGHAIQSPGCEKIGGNGIATYVVNSGALNTQRTGSGTFSVMGIETDDGDVRVAEEPRFYRIDNKGEVRTFG
jgi:Icc-related predicted phosphoesterase